MQKLIEYFRRLTLGGNKESSKRFIALYIGVILITYVVLRYTDSTNVEIILGELIAFVLTLLGIASYETIKGVNNEQR
jgi:Flp pilus assembly protein TadB